MRLFISILLTVSFFSIKCTPAHAVVDHLLVSEVYYDAEVGRDLYEEWVELCNPSLGSIDLTGWVLMDNSGSFTLSGIIKPNDYFVIARDKVAFYDLYAFYPDLPGSTLRLANTGDFLILKYKGTEIDSVGYEGGSTKDNGRFDNWNIYATDAKSIMRSSVDIDTDTPGDWFSDAAPNPGTGPGVIIPEPSTLLLISISLLGIAFFRGKKVRSEKWIR